MESTQNTLLVPYDFTATADNAVSHAVALSGKMKTGIVLLHIVKKESQVSEQQALLQRVADDIEKSHNIKAIALVKDGTIFKTINKVVEELNCLLVIMGTHGMKGMQKLTGSYALKVIVGSKIPYLVVQKPADYPESVNILFPVDHKTESKEKLKWIGFLDQIFDIYVYLFATTGKEGVIDVPTKANLVFCKKYLEERGIKYTIELSELTSTNHEQIIVAAKKVNAQMIVIMTTRDIAFHDYVLGASEQFVIANDEKINVFVVNPRTDLMKYGYGNFG
jgi:nucleotide-binding universal stress UspA family protein